MPLGIVDLVDTGVPVTAQTSIVFSSDPHIAEGADGYSYYVKGPNLGMVVAELLGALLAEEVGLRVPPVAAARRDGEIFAGSQEIVGLRQIMPLLRTGDPISNFGDLFSTIVVDAWLVNIDRNLGNCLARKGHDGRAVLVMIDFEKSVALRGPYPLVECPAIPESRLWPTGDLGTFLRDRRDVFPPPETCRRIRAVTGARLNELYDELQAAIGPVAWRQSSISVLLDRGQRIHDIAGAVWRQ